MSLIGTNPDEVPTNGKLGRMAFQDPTALVLEPQPTATPHTPGSMVFELTSNTLLTVRVRGTDGVVRATTLTLA